MGDLSLRGHEIENLKAQLHNLQEQKIKIDNAYVAEIQKSHMLTERIDTLENESTISQTLSQAKENIWKDINECMTYLWPSI